EADSVRTTLPARDPGDEGDFALQPTTHDALPSRQIANSTGGAASGVQGHQLAGIGLDDHPALLIRHLGEVFGDAFAAVGPVRVGVRVIDLDEDVLYADPVAVVHAMGVVDETSPEVFLDQFGRPGVFVDFLVPAVPLPGVVHALHQIWQPADPTLGQHHLQLGVPLQQAGEHDVGQRPHEVRGKHADRHGEGRVRIDNVVVHEREAGDEAARTEVQAHGHIGVL